MAVNPVILRAIQRAYRHGHADLPTKSVEQVRQYYYQHKIEQLSAHVYEEHPIKPKVFLRIYRPDMNKRTGKCKPVVFYLRASAYVLGSIDDAGYFCHALAKSLDVNVVSIEPRLSPEQKFPEPFLDCIASIEYIYNHHQHLNLDIQNATIWGESSGANLAAALCQYLSSEQLNFISKQILFYPMLDYSNLNEYHSKYLYAKGFLMDTLLSDWFLNQYVRTADDYEDIRVSPLLADNFAKLPKTLLILAQYDPMRDEAAQYIKRLKEAKVSVHALCLPGMIHGFLWYAPRVPLARYAIDYAADYIKDS